MKKILFVFALGLFAISSFAQSVSESTIKRVSLGYDVYSSLWLDMPLGVDSRTINQGINVFAMYNQPLTTNKIRIDGLGQI